MDTEVTELRTDVEVLRFQIEAQSFIISSLCSAWGDSAATVVKRLEDEANAFNQRLAGKSDEIKEQAKPARDLFSMAIHRLNAKVRESAAFPGPPKW